MLLVRSQLSCMSYEWWEESCLTQWGGWLYSTSTPCLLPDISENVIVSETCWGPYWSKNTFVVTEYASTFGICPVCTPHPEHPQTPAHRRHGAEAIPAELCYCPEYPAHVDQGAILSLHLLESPTGAILFSGATCEMLCLVAGGWGSAAHSPGSIHK